MKNNQLFLAASILLALAFQAVITFAQSPQKVSYQMLVRDATGELVKESTVGVQISILQVFAGGDAVYVETHTPQSNVNGLVSLEVGSGIPVSGSFSAIDWSAGPYFLKVETDPAGGTSYTVTGTTEILSVPYALHAKTVETETQSLSDVLAINNLANNQLKNVTDPTDAQDAVTKAYVDELKNEIVLLKNTNEAGGGIIDERDGNYYNTVKIGEQVWMAENLKYLPSVDGPGIGSGTTPYYYVYNYDGTDVNAAKATSSFTDYCVLYNWPAAINEAASSTVNPSGVQGVCPSGWHLPSDEEWSELENNLADNGYNYDGTIGGGRLKIAKAIASKIGWTSSSNLGAVGNTDYPEYRNKSGFTALPGGFRGIGGTFLVIGSYGHWWSATEKDTNFAWFRGMRYSDSDVYSGIGSKECGFSVRCVRN